MTFFWNIKLNTLLSKLVFRVSIIRKDLINIFGKIKVIIVFYVRFVSLAS